MQGRLKKGIAEHSMTQGNALRQLLSFAMPLLIGNLFQQTYNIADSAIVGRFLGAHSFEAIGVSTSVQFFVLGFCGGIMNGFGIPIASEFGADRHSEVKRYVYNGSILTVVCSLIISALTIIFCGNILNLIKTPSEIFKEAYIYLVIIFAGIPFTMAYNYFSAIMRAVGDSRSPFIFLAFSSALNILLDVAFLVVFKMGIEGASIATVLSQAVSAILCYFWIKKKLSVLKVDNEYRKFSKKRSLKLMNMGLPMGVQSSIIAIGSMVMQTANNSLGTVNIGGFAAASKIKHFAMAPIDAMGVAASTFVSQNLGAQKLERVHKGFRITFASSLIYGVLIGSIIMFFGRDISKIFVESSEIEVLSASGKYLKYMGMFYFALSIQVCTRFAVAGLGYTKPALVSGLIEMVVRTIVSFGLVGRFGMNAICASDPCSWCSALLFIVPTALYCLKKTDKKFKEI